MLPSPGQREDRWDAFFPATSVSILHLVLKWFAWREHVSVINYRRFCHNKADQIKTQQKFALRHWTRRAGSLLWSCMNKLISRILRVASELRLDLFIHTLPFPSSFTVTQRHWFVPTLATCIKSAPAVLSFLIIDEPLSQPVTWKADNMIWFLTQGKCIYILHG